MPDIAMCKNEECQSKDKCLRYLSIPIEFQQVYVEFKPESGEKNCIYIIKIDRKNATRNS